MKSVTCTTCQTKFAHFLDIKATKMPASEIKSKEETVYRRYLISNFLFKILSLNKKTTYLTIDIPEIISMLYTLNKKLRITF